MKVDQIDRVMKELEACRRRYLKAVGRINTLLNINDARARQLVEEYQKLLDSD